MIEEAKKSYFERGKSLAKEKNDTAAYYKLVNGLKDGEAPKSFDLKSLRPDASLAELADELAHFFNRITRDYLLLKKREQAPTSNTRMLEHFEVSVRLRKFKKPRSMIYGDIYPDLTP